MNRRLSIPIACTLALAASAAFAQPEDEPLPSLDELLGLEEKDESAPKHEVDTDAADAELNRELAQDKPIADEFLEAVGLMHESAGRLGTRGDTGVVTQRLQEDILRRLDELIDRAGEQSSSSSQSQSQQDQQSQQQPNQQRREEEQQQNQGEPSDRQDGPAGQDAQLGAQALLDGARWGNLPERLREALLQGSSDSYSSLYKSMTESYYKRLAEEASE
jgi:Ca-activated chloride channel family protein